jgi:hypothetical protein
MSKHGRPINVDDAAWDISKGRNYRPAGEVVNLGSLFSAKTPKWWQATPQKSDLIRLAEWALQSPLKTLARLPKVPGSAGPPGSNWQRCQSDRRHRAALADLAGCDQARRDMKVSP